MLNEVAGLCRFVCGITKNIGCVRKRRCVAIDGGLQPTRGTFPLFKKLKKSWGGGEMSQMCPEWRPVQWRCSVDTKRVKKKTELFNKRANQRRASGFDSNMPFVPFRFEH